MSGEDYRIAPEGFISYLSPTNPYIDDLRGKLLNKEADFKDGNIRLFLIKGDTEFGNVARSVEDASFEGRLKDEPNTFKAEYAQYEENSVFYLAVNDANELVGVVRVIKSPDLNGSKTINDMSGGRVFPKTIDVEELWCSAVGSDDVEREVDPKRVWDIATVGLLPDFSGKKDVNGDGVKSLALMLEKVLTDAEASEVTDFVSIVHEHIDNICKLVGINWLPLNTKIPENFTYIGSPNNRAGKIRVNVLRDNLNGIINALFGRRN